MTFSKADPRTQVKTRVSGERARRIEAYAEREGVSKAELLRRALDGVVPEADDDLPLDPKARKAYLWLRHNADDFGRVPSKLALSGLAQKLSMDKRMVRETRLRPLEEDGWIRPKYSYIEVLQ